MRVTREPKVFQPVTITLTSQKELEDLVAVLGLAHVLYDLYTELKKEVDRCE